MQVHFLVAFLLDCMELLQLQQQIITPMNFSMQIQVIALMEKQYPDIKINQKMQLQQPIKQLYTHKPNPQLSIGQLRYIAESVSQVSSAEAHAVAEKILHFMTNLINTLENNENARLSWTMGSVRGRVEKETKINLRELETEINILSQLIEQCKYGVTCKSELTDLLNRRRKEIFRWIDDSRLLKNIRELYLPEMPENYEHLQLLNDDSYEIIYQSILQKLLTYQNAISQFLRQQLSFRDFQQICYELMRQDIVLINNNKTNELIKYSWNYCAHQYIRFTRMRDRIHQMRLALIHSIIRSYYIAFVVKGKIEELNEALMMVESEMLGSSVSKGGANLGRNSVACGSSSQEIIAKLQNSFTNIFTYLTDKNETIFLSFYEKKLKKRVAKLFQIEDKLTHFFKIIFNPDYADQNNPSKLISNSGKESRIEQKFKQVRELFEEMKPLNEKQFKVLFQEIQRLGLFFEQSRAGREWEYKLLELQKSVMREYLFDKNGERKFKAETPMERFSKSRVKQNNKSFNSYEVNKDEVFQDTIEEFNQKRLSSSGRGQQQHNLQQINRQQIYKEGKDLLEGIKPQFGSQFMDLVNFKAYILPKLIKRVEVALSQTAYSDQPLYLHLASLIQNLHLLPSIIKPQINEKKIDLIFFPKVNSKLFTSLKTMMINHYESLSTIYSDLQRDHIKFQNLPDNFRGFMENRLRYLNVLLENIDKLQEIAISVDNLNLKKISYDITSQGTYNLILKLLLASKEIKVYQQAMRDRISNKNPAEMKALKLLSEFIYPNFINSLLLVFQNSKKGQSPNILSALLELSDDSKKIMVESQQYLDTIMRLMQDLLNKRSGGNLRSLLQEFNTTLRSFNSKAEELINECYNYSCINSDTLNRQRIRILQFLELIHNGPGTTAEIIDEKSRKFQVYLRSVSS